MRLVLSDAVVVGGLLLAATIFLAAQGTEEMPISGVDRVPYWFMAILFGAVWMIFLEVSDSRSEHIVGHGSTEYRLVANVTLGAFLTAITAAFFARAELSRGVALILPPIAIFVLVGSRWCWRQWLRRQQRRGVYLHRAVVIGEPHSVEHIHSVMGGSEGTGYVIVGAITRLGRPLQVDVGLDVISDYAHAVEAIDVAQVDTVIVSGTDDIAPRMLRELGWAMADRDVQWVVAPAMTDIAGPRIHARPVAGLPLVHVTFPTMQGVNRVLKRSFDVLGSAGLILVLSPVFLVVALTVRLSSKGPVFYRQERIGLGGAPFGMIKFRSMVQNADDQLASLLDLQGTSDTPLFKVSNDPRITPLGRVLRKYSIDELPQLFNVLLGEMSLVGPRPQREAEVALYDESAHRRLLVKPGMSGLWQVSGRSRLSWEDAIRLDLYYVENWSMSQDLIILFRTFNAVFFPGGSAH